MTANIEKALEIVRNFTEEEFHSFMEQLYISENAVSNVSFNDLIGKIASKTVSFVRIATPILPLETANATACKTTNAKSVANISQIPPIPLH